VKGKFNLFIDILTQINLQRISRKPQIKFRNNVTLILSRVLWAH